MLTTQSIPPSISTRNGAVMSRAVKKKLGLRSRWERLARVPVKKLSRATTVWPSARRRSHMCDPTNPAAPETTIRKVPPSLHSSEAGHRFTCYIQKRTVYDRRILVGTGNTCSNSPHIVRPVLVAFPQSPECDSGFAHYDRFRVVAAGAEDQAVSMGSHAAGEGDRTATFPRAGPRLRLLGISGLRTGDHQSHSVGIQRAIPDPRFGFRQFLPGIRGGVGRRGGDLDRWAIRLSLRGLTGVAGQSGAGIGFHRIPDLHPDGDVSRRTLDRRGIST